MGLWHCFLKLSVYYKKCCFLATVNLHVNCLESDCILRGRLYLAIVVSRIPLIYIVDLQLNKFPCNFWAKSCEIHHHLSVKIVAYFCCHPCRVSTWDLLEQH
jgi:hypothetical protein